MSREDKRSWAEGLIGLCLETNGRSVCVFQMVSGGSGLFPCLTCLLTKLIKENFPRCSPFMESVVIYCNLGLESRQQIFLDGVSSGKQGRATSQPRGRSLQMETMWGVDCFYLLSLRGPEEQERCQSPGSTLSIEVTLGQACGPMNLVMGPATLDLIRLST